MKIAGLRVNVEKWVLGSELLTSKHLELRIRITTEDGLECNVTEIVREDDLISMFDYIWRETGRTVKGYLETQDENLSKSG